MSEARSGAKCYWWKRKFTEEHLENLHKGHKGHIPWNKGKRGIYSEETRKKIGDAHTGSNNFFYGKKRPDHAEKMKIKRIHQVFPQKDTKIEVVIQEALSSRGISFRKHEPIQGQPDIFVPPNTCVFIDGCYWHGCEKCEKSARFKNIRQRDIEISETLRNNGYIVTRIWEHEIKIDLNKCIDRIIYNIPKIEVSI